MRSTRGRKIFFLLFHLPQSVCANDTLNAWFCDSFARQTVLLASDPARRHRHCLVATLSSPSRYDLCCSSASPFSLLMRASVLMAVEPAWRTGLCPHRVTPPPPPLRPSSSTLLFTAPPPPPPSPCSFSSSSSTSSLLFVLPPFLCPLASLYSLPFPPCPPLQLHPSSSWTPVDPLFLLLCVYPPPALSFILILGVHAPPPFPSLSLGLSSSRSYPPPFLVPVPFPPLFSSSPVSSSSSSSSPSFLPFPYFASPFSLPQNLP